MGWILLYLIVVPRMKLGFLIAKWRSYSGSAFLVVRRDSGPFLARFWTESFRVEPLKDRECSIILDQHVTGVDIFFVPHF
jgi:hypothetical protein